MFRHLFLTAIRILLLYVNSQVIMNGVCCGCQRQTMKILKSHVDVNLLEKDCDGPQIFRLLSPTRKMSKAKMTN